MSNNNTNSWPNLAEQIQAEESKKFLSSLSDFLINTGHLKSNQKGKLEDSVLKIEPLKLYKLVCRRGGFQSVTNRKQWLDIASEVNVTDIPKLRNFYCQYLHPYEQKYYFGKDDNEDNFPNLICGQPRKVVKIDQNSTFFTPENMEILQQVPREIGNQGSSTNIYPQNGHQLQPVNPASAQSQKNKNPVTLPQTGTLEEQITKKFEAEEKERKAFFLNKEKLVQTKAQTKKIILGLQPFTDLKDNIYSLNMLLLYSANVHSPFLFQNNEKIFSALSKYAHSLYPIKCTQSLQNLRMVTLIFRNMTMNPINLKYILGTDIFELFVTMFNTGADPEQCSRNIIDIMTGLVKVGWKCERIFSDLNRAILNDEKQVIQYSVELLRGLVDQREQVLLSTVPVYLTSMNRVLMSSIVSTDIKEQVFEILAFVTDASSLESKQQIAKNSELMGIIMAVLQHLRKHEKLTQLAALTLSNISNAVHGKMQIKEYQTQLVVIGFSDDSLAGIIANILADIATI